MKKTWEIIFIMFIKLKKTALCGVRYIYSENCCFCGISVNYLQFENSRRLLAYCGLYGYY